MKQINLRRVRAVGAMIFLTLLAANECRADGFMLPPKVIEKLPDIPRQRALIAYRDGLETLIVESSFDGAGKDIAWIVPVPAAPTRIEKASSGIFTALELSLEPKVQEGGHAILLVGVFLVFWALFVLAAGRFVPYRAAFMAALMMLLIFKIAMDARVFTLGDPINPAATDVRASGVSLVGNYEVQVLEADSADAINAWLRANAFRDIPDKAIPIVSDYIANQWRFVVARLRREADGFSTPHPLLLTFPTDKPVYPMRLTPLAGSDLRLDLFVIADQQATARFLNVRHCAVFSRAKNLADVEPSYCETANDPIRIGLPALLQRMGDRSVVTWLRADLPPDKMTEDYYLDFCPPTPVGHSAYLPLAASRTAAGAALILTGTILLCGFLGYYRRPRLAKRQFILYLIAAIALSLGAAVYIRIMEHLPQATPMHEAQRKQYDAFIEKTIALLNDYPDVLKKMGFKEIQQYFADAATGIRNPYTGEPLRLEEAPGGLTITEEGENIVACAFDETGMPKKRYIKGTALPLWINYLRNDPEFLKSDLRFPKRALNQQGWDDLPPVLELLQDPDPAFRGLGVNTLSDLFQRGYSPAFASEDLTDRPVQSAIDALIRLLNDESMAVRRGAISALGDAGVKARAAVPQLAQQIDDPQEDIGMTAVRSLGHLGNDALPILLKRLGKFENKAIRAEAVEALRGFGPEAIDAVPALINILNEEPSTIIVRDKEQILADISVAALSQIGPAAIPALTQALRDPNFRVDGRANAARAIGDMRKSGHAALPDLLAESQNPEISIRIEVISALGSVVEKVEEVRPALTAAAKDQNPKVRYVALHALHSLDPEQYPDVPRRQ